MIVARWLTPDEREIVFETDWKTKYDEAVARLMRLEGFEQKLFDRLNEAGLPEDNRQRIEGVDSDDDGLLGYVQKEIRTLIRCIPYYRMNAELTAMRRANTRAIETQMVQKLFVPAEVRKWIEESSSTEVNG